MAELSEDIVNLVKEIVIPLVENPDDVVFESSAGMDGTVYVDIRVNPDDAGKVIGRQGRVIKAIRTIARAVASREGAHAEVELLD